MNKVSFLACAILLLCIYGCRLNNGNVMVSDRYYDSLINITGEKFDAGDVPGCFRYLDSMYAGMPNLSETGEMKKYLFNAYLYGSFLHDYVHSNVYTDSAVRLLELSKDENFKRQFYADAHYAKGDASFDAGNYRMAYSNYYLAKADAIQKKDTCALCYYNYRLGMVMYKQQHYPEAAAYFSESFTQTAGCTQDFITYARQQELLNNVALSYSCSNQTDSALQYYNRGLAFIDDHGKSFEPGKTAYNNVARAVIYGNMAKIFAGKKSYDTAIALLRKSINVNIKKGGDNKDAQTAMVTLAGIYNVQKNYSGLYSTLNEIKESVELVNNPEARLKWNELMWEYYKAQGRPANGYNYLDAYIALKDSLAENKFRLNEVNVNAQLSNMAYQNTIDKLKQDEAARKIALAVALVFAVLILVILCLIIHNAKRSKTNVKKLTVLNAEIMDKQQQLQQALSALETQLKQKDRILRIVAHDLRSPISGIAGLSSLLLQTSGEPDPDVQIIHDVANDAMALINEILEVAGLVKATEMVKKPLSINDLLFNCVSLQQFKAHEKHQKIDTDFEDLNDPIDANKEKISRVVNNLLSNSIKFSPEDTTIIVKSRRVGSGIIISIKDNGIGMPAGAGDTVFDVFTGAKRPGTAGEKSFGLGLSICKQLIEDHSGKIWYESTEGNGTTFYIKLYYAGLQPQQDVSQASIPAI